MIKISYVSPYDNQKVELVLTEAQAAEWWAKASQPIRETVTITETTDL